MSPAIIAVAYGYPDQGYVAANWYSQGTHRDKWIGALQAGAFGFDWSQGVNGQAWCIESGADVAVVANRYEELNPAVSYLLWKAEQTSDGNERASAQVALYRHAYPSLQSSLEHSRIDALPQIFLDRAAQLWNEAQSNAGPYAMPTAFTSTGVSMAADHRSGTIQHVGVTNAAGYVAGFSGTLTLYGDAVFTDTGSQSRSITSTSSGQSFAITSTGNGSIYASASFTGLPASTVTRAADATYQDGVAFRGTTSVSASTGTLPTSISFQPQVSTAVTQGVVAVGGTLVDRVTFSAAAGQTWSLLPDTPNTFVPVVASYTIYGPFATVPSESVSVPAGAPVFDTGSVTRSGGPGAQNVSASRPVTASGYYTWVWTIRQASQPEAYRAYITGDFTDRFGLAAETSLVPYVPQITSQVATVFLDGQSVLRDQITVTGAAPGTQAGDPTVVTHTLYGPYATRPTSSTATPASLVIAQTTTPLTNGSATAQFAVANASAGWYVVRSSVPQQGRYAAVTTSAGDQSEQAVKHFAPVVTTTAAARVSVGEALTDRVVPSNLLTGGWPTINGAAVSVMGSYTIYGPLSSPPGEQDQVPADAPIFATGTQTLTGAAVNVTGPIAPAPGYYAWVWTIDKGAQTGWVADLIVWNGNTAQTSWSDRYGIAAETTLVPWEPQITSSQRVAATGTGTAITDTITQSGFPDNHGDLDTDITSITHTLYGPYATSAEITTGWVAGERIVHTIETDTTNAVTDITFEAVPAPGWYVVVSEYAGDERTGSILTAATDPAEQVTVIEITTTAQQYSAVGYPITDTAHISGDIEGIWTRYGLTPPEPDVSVDPDGNADPGSDGDDTNTGLDDGAGTDDPDLSEGDGAPDTGVDSDEEDADADADVELGVTAIFELWRHGAGEVDTDSLVTTTDPVAVTTAGDYVSPQVTVDVEGTYYWIEHLVVTYPDTTGDITSHTITSGQPRLPDETTIVVAVTTLAQPYSAVGYPITDTAQVTGPGTPDGAQLMFELWQRGDGDLHTDILVATTDPVPVDGPGEYASPEVTVTEPGTYYWRELLTFPGIDEPVHIGQPRLPEESTFVTGVSTRATSRATVGAAFTDLASVVGPGVPDGTELVFELWRQGDGDLHTDILVATTDPVAVDGPGEYRSPEAAVDEAGTYYWIERLRYPGIDGSVHVGAARLAIETTVVTVTPDLPRTGFAWVPVGMGGMALVLAGTLITLGARRKP